MGKQMPMDEWVTLCVAASYPLQDQQEALVAAFEYLWWLNGLPVFQPVLAFN